MPCLTRPYVDGGVSRLKGLFGVGKSIETAIPVLTIFLQANNLYVYDSKALQSILVKEQPIYEETESFIEYVL